MLKLSNILLNMQGHKQATSKINKVIENQKNERDFCLTQHSSIMPPTPQLFLTLKCFLYHICDAVLKF